MFRPLHYVFRLGNRKTIKSFFIDLLGMKILRHEEFKEGCEATCNGPYHGKWSKTMIGYGDEADHFVIELTYNYGICSYQISNDLKFIKISSTQALSNIKQSGYHHVQLSTCPETVSIQSPDGYQFMVEGLDRRVGGDPVGEVRLNARDLRETIDYYTCLLPGRLVDSSLSSTSAIIEFDNYQFKLALDLIEGDIVKTSASGRIAFSYDKEVSEIEKKIRDDGKKIQTSLITLKTPGKASVDVVILLDPNDHEICVVGDSGFRELSRYDPTAVQLLDDAMKADKSDEWFSRKGGKLVC